METPKSVWALQNFLEKVKGENYPLSGHPLSGVESGTKNAYLRMLCLLASVGGIAKEELLFLRRLAKGAGCEQTVEDYVGQAAELEQEGFLEFKASLEKCGLKKYFFVDALVLIHLADPSQEAVAFLASLMENLGTDRKMVEALCQVAKDILQQDFPACLCDSLTCLDFQTQAFPFASYFGQPDAPSRIQRLLVGGTLVLAAPEMTTAQLSPCFNDLNMGGMPVVGETSLCPASLDLGCTSKRIRLGGVKRCIFYNIRLPLFDLPQLIFWDIPLVEFVNCTLIGGGKRELAFASCDTVSFYNCRFEDFNWTVIDGTGVGTIKVEGCSFFRCVKQYSVEHSDWEIKGCVIRSARAWDGSSASVPTQLHLIQTRMEDCGGLNENNYWKSSFISNCAATITGCTFLRCWHDRLNQYGNHDPSNSSRVMFRNIVRASDNQVEDSAALGPTA